MYKITLLLYIGAFLTQIPIISRLSVVNFGILFIFSMPNSGFEHRAGNLHSSKIHQQVKTLPHRVLYVIGWLKPSLEALSLFLLPAQTPDSLSQKFVGTPPSCQPLRPPTPKDYIFVGQDAK